MKDGSTTSDFEFDDEEIMKEDKVVLDIKPKATKQVKRKIEKQTDTVENTLINCLQKERISVTFVPKQTGIVTNPKHIYYGGMADNASRWFSVPQTPSGALVPVLTEDERMYLEEIMGLEYNALSLHKKVDNYWTSSSARVRLKKTDNYFDLSNPEDFIKYKILLANKDHIAASLEALQDRPKATYQFVIVKEGDETKRAKKDMSVNMQSYMRFGEIQDDIDMLRVIAETIDGRPLSTKSSLEFIQSKINTLIQSDAKLFLTVANDPLLSNKVLIKKCIEASLISNRGGMLYLRADNSPLCENGEDPTLTVAAKYLASPKRQELKFSLEAKLKQ